MVFAADYPLLDVFWTTLMFFLWVIWFWLLITVFTDIFRRHELSGWAKTLWIVFVIVLPYLGVFIYLITQGDNMARRKSEQIRASSEAIDDRIRTVSGAGSPADQIAKAKELLDAGTIDQAEFDQIKRQALA